MAAAVICQLEIDPYPIKEKCDIISKGSIPFRFFSFFPFHSLVRSAG
jgi:hypothetical protein